MVCIILHTKTCLTATMVVGLRVSNQQNIIRWYSFSVRFALHILLMMNTIAHALCGYN